MIYLVYFGVGVALAVAGLGGYALAERVTTVDDSEDPDPVALFARAGALFVAMVGVAGAIFGGVGVVVGLI